MDVLESLETLDPTKTRMFLKRIVSIGFVDKGACEGADIIVAKAWTPRTIEQLRIPDDWREPLRVFVRANPGLADNPLLALERFFATPAGRRLVRSQGADTHKRDDRTDLARTTRDLIALTRNEDAR